VLRASTPAFACFSLGVLSRAHQRRSAGKGSSTDMFISQRLPRQVCLLTNGQQTRRVHHFLRNRVKFIRHVFVDEHGAPAKKPGSHWVLPGVMFVAHDFDDTRQVGPECITNGYSLYSLWKGLPSLYFVLFQVLDLWFVMPK